MVIGNGTDIVIPLQYTASEGWWLSGG